VTAPDAPDLPWCNCEVCCREREKADALGVDPAALIQRARLLQESAKTLASDALKELSGHPLAIVMVTHAMERSSKLLVAEIAAIYGIVCGKFDMGKDGIKGISIVLQEIQGVLRIAQPALRRKETLAMMREVEAKETP